MAEKAVKRTPVDPRVYAQNRGKFTYEELAKYADQWVAWSVDGSRIVAHHEDFDEVIRMVQEAGLTSEDVVLGLEPPAGVDSLL